MPGCPYLNHIMEVMKMIIPIKDSEIVTEEETSFGYFYIISHKTSKVIDGYLEYEEGDENDT